MSNKPLLKITPTILIHQSMLTPLKRNAIFQSLHGFSNKIKYKYPSLQKANCCFSKKRIQSNYNSPSDKYINLSNCTLMVENHKSNINCSSQCRYKRLPPLFHLLPRDSSIIKGKTSKRKFQSQLHQMYLTDKDDPSNPLICIKENLCKSTKELKVRNIKDKLFNLDNMLPNKALNPSKSFWVTNDKINKDNKKNYIPKYRCIYSKKDQKEINYSVLFPRKITLIKRGTLI